MIISDHGSRPQEPQRHLRWWWWGDSWRAPPRARGLEWGEGEGEGGLTEVEGGQEDGKTKNHGEYVLRKEVSFAEQLREVQ